MKRTRKKHGGAFKAAGFGFIDRVVIVVDLIAHLVDQGERRPISPTISSEARPRG
jgi:hypothetical protein